MVDGRLGLPGGGVVPVLMGTLDSRGKIPPEDKNSETLLLACAFLSAASWACQGRPKTTLLRRSEAIGGLYPVEKLGGEFLSPQIAEGDILPLYAVYAPGGVLLR